MGKYLAEPEQQQALARLKCAHCQSLIDCEALARAVLAELRSRYGVGCLRPEGDSEVSEAQLIEAVREGIGRFLHDSSDSASNEGLTSAA